MKTALFLLIDQKNPGTIPNRARVEVLGETKKIFYIRDLKTNHHQWAWKKEILMDKD